MNTRKFTADGILTHRKRITFELTEAEYQAAIEKHGCISDYVYDSYDEDDYKDFEIIAAYHQPLYDPNSSHCLETRSWNAAFVKEWTMQLVAGKDLSATYDNGTYKG
jgi:hypothetical protein